MNKLILELNLNGGNHIIELTARIDPPQILYEELPQSFPGTISAMAISPINYSHWYVLTDNGKFYHSENSGQSWSTNQWFTGPNAHYFYGSAILPSPVDLGKVYISGSGYSNPAVYVSNNHGNSFFCCGYSYRYLYENNWKRFTE